MKTDVTVVGGANVDIGGKPDHTLQIHDSNPGTVQISLGGVGRNMAHNLAMLGHSVRFISAIGEDTHARHIIESCRELSIDTEDCFRTSEAPTSTYLFITDQDGEMEAAISDMRIAELLTPSFIQEKTDQINDASLLIIDTNLPKETVREIVKLAKIPVFAETVSRIKAEKLRDVLPFIHTITPNALEAEVLTGLRIDPDDMTSLEGAADTLLAKGLKQVVITLGARGVFYSDGSESGLIKTLPCDVESGNGAGDALISAVASGFIRGFPFRDAVMLGMAAAAMTVETTATNHPGLSFENVYMRAGIE